MATAKRSTIGSKSADSAAGIGAGD